MSTSDDDLGAQTVLDSEVRRLSGLGHGRRAIAELLGETERAVRLSLERQELRAPPGRPRSGPTPDELRVICAFIREARVSDDTAAERVMVDQLLRLVPE